MTLRERLYSAAFGAGWGLVCRLPEPVARSLFNLGADIAWSRQGAGVQVLEGNLSRVLRTGECSSPDQPSTSGEAGQVGRKVLQGADPRDADEGEELRRLSRAVMRSYARYYLETFRLQTIPIARIQAGMHVNQENVDLTIRHL